MAEQRVVLAYSGGLDTSVIVPWLKENYGCEVICYTADVGQGEELSGLPEKAAATGASKLIIEDYHGSVELMLFGKDFVEYNKYMVQGLFVYVRARVQERYPSDPVVGRAFRSVVSGARARQSYHGL